MNGEAVVVDMVVQFYKFIYFVWLRMRLKNRNITILSNNCTAGVIYHKLKLKFLSTTINLQIDNEDFLELVQHLCEYENSSLIEGVSSKAPYPIGILEGGDLKNIKIKFMHYKSFEEAKEKWFERYKRINYDNICIIMETGITTTGTIKDIFHQLPFHKKVIFVNEKDASYPESYFVDIYGADYVYGKLLFRDMCHGIGQYLYLDRFDYVNFLNSGEITSAHHIKKNTDRESRFSELEKKVGSK